AWRLTGPLAEQADLAAQLEQVRRDASEERHSTAPLRAAVDAAGHRLRARLTQLAGEAAARAKDAQLEAERQDRLRAEHEQAAGSAQHRLTEAVGRVATAQDRLDELARRRRD